MNIFKIDKPNSFEDFCLTCLYLILYTLGIGTIILLAFWNNTLLTENLRLITSGICLLLFFIFAIYITFLNYTKRLWDIVGNKKDAIFYTIAIIIANIAMSFIPFCKYISILFSIVILAILFFKKGQLRDNYTNIFKLDQKRQRRNFIAVLTCIIFWLFILSSIKLTLASESNNFIRIFMNIVEFVIAGGCIYTLWVNLIKRFWDIISNKKVSVIISSLIVLLSLGLIFIKPIKVFVIVIDLIIMLFLAIRKGKSNIA